MKCNIVIFSLLLVLTACQEGSKGVLPVDKEKAVAIIADVRLASEVAKYYGQEADSVLQTYMDSIFKIHKIDSTQYQSMMGYLEQSIGEYHALEQQVHDQLKKYQAAREPKEEVEKDD